MARRKKRYLVVGMNGDPCPRCNRATQIREHIEITDKQLAQPFYYSRWFYCINPNCRTNLIMPDRYRVFPSEQSELISWRGLRTAKGR